MTELSLIRPDDRDRELEALGLQEQYLLGAIQAGENARGGATSNDPPNAAGTLDYFARIRTLREELKPLGWEPRNHNQLPLAVNADKTLAVGVLQGDARTGLPGVPHPRSRRPTGAAKASLIARNQELALFALLAAEDDGTELGDDEYARMETWYLLTYRYEAKNGGAPRSAASCRCPMGSALTGRSPLGGGGFCCP